MIRENDHVEILNNPDGPTGIHGVVGEVDTDCICVHFTATEWPRHPSWWFNKTDVRVINPRVSGSATKPP
jgi:hypothetical protein